MITYTPQPPWNFYGSVGSIFESTPINITYNTPGFITRITITAPTANQYTLPPGVDVAFYDPRNGATTTVYRYTGNKNDTISFDIPSGTSLIFKTAVPNVLVLAGTFNPIIKFNNDSFSNNLNFTIVPKPNIICDGVPNTIIDGAFYTFPCTDSILNTKMGSEIGAFTVQIQQNLSTAEIWFRPDTGHSNIDYLVIFSDPISISGSISQILPAVPGFNYRFKLNNYPVFYDVLITDSFSTNKVRISINNATTGIINTPDLMPPVTIDLCDLQEVPRIGINSQTDSFGLNIGETIFTVTDTKKYGDYYCKDNALSLCPDKCIYQSTFVKYPQVQKVLLGNVCPGSCNCNCTEGTITQKIQFLINKFGINLALDDFFGTMTTYSTLRYILSRLLYGHFSVKFLLGKYYSNFMTDLKQSRYFRFATFFETPQLIELVNSPPILVDFSVYHKYFMYDINVCFSQNPVIGNTTNCSNQAIGNTTNSSICIPNRFT